MNQQAKKQQPEKKSEQPYSFSDETTQKKIKKHLTDIKDVITETDIANVKIPGKENDAEIIPGENETETENLDLLKKKPLTPWDALEE